jgi:hypothetical protein
MSQQNTCCFQAAHLADLRRMPMSELVRVPKLLNPQSPIANGSFHSVPKGAVITAGVIAARFRGLRLPPQGQL